MRKTDPEASSWGSAAVFDPATRLQTPLKIMAPQGSAGTHPGQAPHHTMSSDISHLQSSISAVDTSYNGAQGLIDDLAVDLDRDDYRDTILPSPTKAVLTQRQPLSARLLSAVSNAQTSEALNRSRSVLHSRTKSIAQFVNSSTTSLDAESTASTSSRRSSQFLGNLFAGESAPMRLGVASSPTKEEPEPIMPEYRPALTERPTARRADSSRNDGRKSSWFARKFTPIAAPSVAPSRPIVDSLVSMDINTCLFPHGPADPHDPHAFNELLLNATSLLQRMQAAYREKTEYLANIQPEIEAQKEEVEEAETRSRHLKMQLQDMCNKAAEQDRAMQEMAAQLAQEKMKRLEEQERAARSVRLVKSSADQVNADRFRKRSSAGSASDSGFESDYAESVMSMGMDAPSITSMPPPPTAQPMLSRQSTLRSTTSFGSADAYNSIAVGGDAPAWSTVDRLRRENKDLNRQVFEMQRALQGCIDLVGNVTI